MSTQKKSDGLGLAIAAVVIGIGYIFVQPYVLMFIVDRGLARYGVPSVGYWEAMVLLWLILWARGYQRIPKREGHDEARHSFSLAIADPVRDAFICLALWLVTS